jgi:UDP-N-acetylglucosamine:LPS N-acetylglucosamine transferase
VPKSGLPGDHQTANARSLETSGAARVVVEHDEHDPQAGRITALDPEELARLALELRRDEAARRAMGEKAKALHVPGAAEAIVREVEKLLTTA